MKGGGGGGEEEKASSPFELIFSTRLAYLTDILDSDWLRAT